MEKKARWLFDHVFSVLAALFLVFFIRSSFYESYKIPSGSMIPTILIGDHVFVNKFSYRFNLPFSEYFGESVTLLNRGAPKVGDIIVFESPRNPKINYIKRVVGLPGDQIAVRDRKLLINGKPILSVFADEEESKKIFKLLKDPKLDESEMALSKEILNNQEHWTFLDRNNFVSESFGPYEVPEGRIFVMGDNRDFSDDSRFLGTIAIEKIRGRASWIWLSIWLRFSPFEFEFRPLRIGKSLYSL